MVIKSRNAPGNARRVAAEGFARGLGDADQVVEGEVAVVRRVAVAGDPKATVVPKFDCGDGLKRSIFLPLDDARIVALGTFLKKQVIKVKGGTFEATRAALQDLLDEFNKAGLKSGALEPNQVLMLSPNPCSLPGHHWTGTGCTPSPNPIPPDPGNGDDVAATGHMFSLVRGKPPKTLFGTVFTYSSSFAFGYCLSAEFKQVIRN